MQLASKALHIGARIEIGIGDVWLPTRLEDLAGQASLTVGWPTLDRQLVTLVPGQTVEVVVVAAADAQYVASAAVDRAVIGALPLVTLALKGEWRRSQRRNAVRAKVAVRPRVADKLQGGAKRPLRLGVTNVSAGGVQVRSQDELREGDLLELAFELNGEVQAKARVVRVERLERIWEAGCAFEDIPETLAQHIVQFIFAQQRALLRVSRGER